MAITKLIGIGLLHTLFLMSLSAEEFSAPAAGNLYFQLTSTESGASEWRLGIGTTAENCRVVMTNTTRVNSAEVLATTVNFGEVVHVCLYTKFGSAAGWAFSNATDLASLVAFTDRDNSLHMGGKIIKPLSATTWQMNLDDAISYLYDDDDNDIVLRLRLEAGSVGPPTLVPGSSGLGFTYHTGGAVPSSQLLALTSSATSLNFLASATGGSWLSVSPPSGVTPATLSLAVNPSGLAPGFYFASVLITASASANPVTSVPVSLTVIADTPFLVPAGIVNAGSYVRGLVPGGVVTIFGVNLSTGVVGTETVQGLSSYKGSSVLIGGRVAPILSVSNESGVEQMNVQVPFETPSAAATTVQVSNNGKSAAVADIPVYSLQPGIFEVGTADGTKVAAVLHGNGRLVTPAEPASRGELLSIWLTGAGRVTPDVATGAGGPIPPALIASPVVVSIGSITCETSFLGYAPFLRGIYQINFRLSDSVPLGNSIQVAVRVGDIDSQTASMAIR